MNPVRIKGLDEVGHIVRVMARTLNLSVTALASSHGSLQAIANRSRMPKDCMVGPLLAVCNTASWELAVRAEPGPGVTITREGALPLLVMGADGDPIDIPITRLSDVGAALHTIAAATDRTVSGLIKAAGSNNTGMVGFATGHGRVGDVRLLNLLRVVHSGGFALYARRQFRNKRQAMLHAEASRLLPAKATTANRSS